MPAASPSVHTVRSTEQTELSATSAAPCLTEQPRGSEHAARPAAALARRRGDDGAVIGRLEQAEAGAAQRHAPDDVGVARSRGQQREQRQARANVTRPSAPSIPADSGRARPAGDRRRHRRRQRPGVHQQAGRHVAGVRAGSGNRMESRHRPASARKTSRPRSQSRGRHWDAQQIDRQQRRGLRQLAPHSAMQESPRREGEHCVQRPPAVADTVDGDDQEAEEERVSAARWVCRKRRPERGVRGSMRASAMGGDAYRHIDSKQPGQTRWTVWRRQRSDRPPPQRRRPGQ